MVFAVIDTNVLVSYFLSRDDSPPVAVVEEIFGGRITPVYNGYLLNEYRDVLHRERLGINRSEADKVLDDIQLFGLKVETCDTGITLPDVKDVPIFEIALSTRDCDSYLVTGNIKHFPKVDFVITPKQMMDLLNSSKDGEYNR